VSSGGKVDEKVRARAEQNAQQELRGTAAKPSGDAGVALYAKSAQLAAIQASENVNASRRGQLEAVVSSPTTLPADRAAAKEMLSRFDENSKALGEAQREIIGKMGDQKFIAGFGSNGGEEFLQLPEHR